MHPIQAILIVVGQSPCVLDLADMLLGVMVKLRMPSGSMKPGGDRSDENVIVAKINTPDGDDALVLSSIEGWLVQNKTALIECHASKTLEFHVCLEPNIGSRILKIPASLIQLATDLKLDIANQAIRILAPDERVSE